MADLPKDSSLGVSIDIFLRLIHSKHMQTYMPFAEDQHALKDVERFWNRSVHELD